MLPNVLKKGSKNFRFFLSPQGISTLKALLFKCGDAQIPQSSGDFLQSTVL